MNGAIPPLPNTTSWHGAQFKETYTDKFNLAGNNVFTLAQMVHGPWWGKRVVLFHMPEPLHRGALVATALTLVKFLL